MTPEEFKRIGIRMYGRKHWRREYSIHLGLNASTIWRMSTRTADIPSVVEVAVRGLLEKHKVLTKLAGDFREQRAREKHRYRGRSSRRPKPKPRRKPRTVIHYTPKESDNATLESPQESAIPAVHGDASENASG